MLSISNHFCFCCNTTTNLVKGSFKAHMAYISFVDDVKDGCE